MPGIKLSENLLPVSELEKEAKKADIIVFAVPSKFIRNSFQSLKGIIDEKHIVNLSKGFESSSLKTISQVASEIFGASILDRWVTISGPSFAKELLLNHPTTVAAASGNENLLKNISRISPQIY